MSMRAIIFSLLLGVALTAQAHNSCNDPELDGTWKKALSDPRADGEVVALAVMRDELCQMISAGWIEADAAHLLWEKTLTRAYVEQARGMRNTYFKERFPRLFGTF